MISTLEVHNFKSIRHLRLDCRRVNVFIGEPNTGKSNILESLGVFSALLTGSLQDFVRMERLTDLFHNFNVGEDIQIKAGPYFFFCQFDAYTLTPWARLEVFSEVTPDAEPLLSVRFNQPRLELREPYPARILFYRFSPPASFQRIPGRFLLPPDGRNLPYLILTNKKLQQLLGDLFASFGLRLVVDIQGEWIRVQMGEGETISSIPYQSVSDTLQRLAFYLAAMKTNQDAILVLEEPEAHAFPLYTKYLAERIALDERNQYFLSTHDPFLLISLVEKTPKDHIAVFVVSLQEGQTSLQPLTGDALEWVLDMDADVFFNLGLLLETPNVSGGEG